MREAGVVAVGVEIVANAAVDDEIRIRAPRIFDECAVDVRVGRDVGRSDAVRVRERQRARVGDVDEESVLVRVEAEAFVNALRGEARFQIMRRRAEAD